MKHLVAPLSINARTGCPLFLAVTTRSSPSFISLADLFSCFAPTADGSADLFQFFLSFPFLLHQIELIYQLVHWVSVKLYFIAGLVSEGDWAPNAQIGRLEG